jgi:hypothetical protein
MKIGYSVEGSTDRAVLKGLQRRWCPSAELLEGRFRGTTGQSARREIPNTYYGKLARTEPMNGNADLRSLGPANPHAAYHDPAHANPHASGGCHFA